MIFRAFLLAVLSVVVAGGCSLASGGPAAASAPAPVVVLKPHAVELTDTMVHEVPSADLTRNYQVWVSVPAGYERGARTYPVVFATDAEYSFPLVRSIRNLLGQRGQNIEDFILVGLPPERGLASKASRRRDYTPSNPLRDPNRSPEMYTADKYGEAGKYRDYLEHQVFPLVAAKYDADMSRKVFIGHSYGGLLGSYILLTRPELFSAYVLGSPSLWFDNNEILKVEELYHKRAAALPAKVMMYVGEYETPGPTSRHFRSVDLVGDMRRFEQRLKARRYSGLNIEGAILAEEDHLTIYPNFVSRGLLWALPGHGPYTGG